jgi:hypothetical protein
MKKQFSYNNPKDVLPDDVIQDFKDHINSLVRGGNIDPVRSGGGMRGAVINCYPPYELDVADNSSLMDDYNKKCGLLFDFEPSSGEPMPRFFENQLDIINDKNDGDPLSRGHYVVYNNPEHTGENKIIIGISRKMVDDRIYTETDYYDEENEFTG